MINPEHGIQGGEISFSASRGKMFDECRRKYFYHYYGFKADPDVARLKKLSAMALWQGVLVHDFCETYLKTHDSIVDEAEQERLIRQVTHGQMPQDFQFSLAGNKSFRLFEHEYGEEIDVLTKKKALLTVQTCIRNFFRSEVLREMMEVGKDNWLSVEELLSFEIGGRNVWIKMDAAYRRPNGTVRVVDWKTGKNDSSNRAQIVGYALYGFRKGWVARPEDLEAVLAYLMRDDFKVVKIELDDLSKVQAEIESTLREMSQPLMDVERNIARMADFPQASSDWPCKRCQYRRPCKG